MRDTRFIKDDLKQISEEWQVKLKRCTLVNVYVAYCIAQIRRNKTIGDLIKHHKVKIIITNLNSSLYN